MRVLLDTQALILAGHNQLPRAAASIYRAPEHEVYFSLVSLWEIGIKVAIGKLTFKRDLLDYHQLLVDVGLLPLSITEHHIAKAVKLPFHHKDPFDRLLAGQALVEKLTIMSKDEYFDDYGCKRIWSSR